MAISLVDCLFKFDLLFNDPEIRNTNIEIRNNQSEIRIRNNIKKTGSYLGLGLFFVLNFILTFNSFVLIVSNFGFRYSNFIKETEPIAKNWGNIFETRHLNQEQEGKKLSGKAWQAVRSKGYQCKKPRIFSGFFTLVYSRNHLSAGLQMPHASPKL